MTDKKDRASKFDTKNIFIAILVIMVLVLLFFMVKKQPDPPVDVNALVQEQIDQIYSEVKTIKNVVVNRDDSIAVLSDYIKGIDTSLWEIRMDKKNLKTNFVSIFSGLQNQSIDSLKQIALRD